MRSHTVIDPWTVMIIPIDTPLTYITMTNLRVHFTFTLRTKIPINLLQFLLNFFFRFF
jgi:hypothetical protein